MGRASFRAFFGQITRHFWDHVARAAHHHGVADHETLARDFVHVVQRGVAHGHAADEHRLELRGGRQRAGAADVEDDVLEQGDLLIGRKFVRQRPARRARHEAELLLVGAAIYFVDHAVDLVRKRGASRADVAVVIEAALHAARPSSPPGRCAAQRS